MNWTMYFFGMAFGIIITLPYIDYQIKKSVTKAFDDQRRLMDEEIGRKRV